MRHSESSAHAYSIFWQRLLLAGCLWLCACAAQAATYSSAATTFAWVDPSAHTNVSWTSGASCSSGYANAPVDDDISAQIALGFTFNYGGVNYTTVQIMSNGRLQFGNGYCGFGTQNVGPPRTYPIAYPNANLLRTMKVYAADLDSGAGGTVRYAALGSSPNRSFVVTWTNVPEWNSPTWTCAQSCFNLQVILNENGEFVYQYGSNANASNGKAQIGWEVTTTDYALYTFANIGSLANSAVRFYIPTMLAEYRLDESAWSGANSVINTASASFYGTPIGAIASTASGYICRGADIPLNTAKNTIDAIDTGINVSSNLGAAGAVSFWYKGRTAWNDGNDRMLIDATSNNSAPFFLSKRSDGRLRFVLQDSANNIFVNETGTHNYAANTWHHIAITWSLGASGRMIVYIDGNIDRQLNVSTSNALDNRGGTLYIGDNQGKAVSNNPTNNSANGYIDEARFYNYAISAAIVNRDRLASHSCSVLNNFLITLGAASASTCTPKSIQITARDAANATLTGYTGSIGLSTSSAHGDWSIVTAGGTLTNGTADDGAAAYGFVAADNGSITLALSDSHADDLTVSVSDASAGVTTVSSTLNFRDNVFVITEDAIQVAGRDQAMSAALWTKDATTGNCAVNTTYDGVMPLKVWLTRDVDDPNGVAPSINAVALPNAQPGASNLSLTFGSGTAAFNLASSDVGKYALNLLDDTRVFADGVDIAGASNTLTTRPFGFGFTAIKQGATANPGGANPGDAVFVAAGEIFEATVGAYRWQAADDANDDGVPDSGADITNNGLTPAFAWPVSLTAALNTPAAGTPGALGGTTAVAQASFSGGAATVNDLTYSEVGSMKLLASASNYLNTASADYTDHSSGVVGRFIPDHFAVSGLVNGSLANACGAFTYTGQMNGAAGAITYLVKPQFTITAQNAASGTTANYTGVFAKLINSGVTIDAPAEDGTQLGKDGVNINLDANIVAGTLTDNGDGSFDYVLGADDFAYQHEENSRVAPFTSDIPLTISSISEPVAADGVTTAIAGQELNPTGVEIRLGRLAVQNAYGSELLDLPITLTAQYYADLDGVGAGTDVGFVTNTDDNCTAVPVANVTVTPNAPLLASDAGLTVASPTLVNGSWQNSKLSKPASGNQGSVDLVVELDAAGLAWLKYDWDGVDQLLDLNNLDDNPTARAVFGIYQGPDRRIYLHERFNN